MKGMPINDEPEPTVTYLGDVQRLHIGPDDVLVLTVNSPLSHEMYKSIRHALQTILGTQQRTLVLEQGMTIGVLVRSEEAALEEKYGLQARAIR